MTEEPTVTVKFGDLHYHGYGSEQDAERFADMTMKKNFKIHRLFLSKRFYIRVKRLILNDFIIF
ncbi:hypothetical protein D7Z54_26935 [Salibacterium salarium]|uniref:Uncharacterized protein n=1 Tax=Salibacterium salarium TaxID=284579 RepID=A0A3R9R9F2_9BACI|nr:hypothetical protein D7Z54_26935 [Salibacterium salarium]